MYIYSDVHVFLVSTCRKFGRRDGRTRVIRNDWVLSFGQLTDTDACLIFYDIFAFVETTVWFSSSRFFACYSL